MKQYLQKLNRNPYWVFIVAFLNFKDLFKPIIKQTMTLGQAFSHIDWGNFITLLVLLTILFFQIKRINYLEAKVDFLENRVADVDKRWSTEVVNNIYPKLIRLSYRIECVMGHNREEWHPQREKEKVEDYFRSDKQGLTVEELNRLMAQHFPELPNVV